MAFGIFRRRIADLRLSWLCVLGALLGAAPPLHSTFAAGSDISESASHEPSAPPTPPGEKTDEKAGDKAGEKNLLGDLGGVRPWLEQYGASFNLSEISEVFGNPSGGLRRGAIYEGLSEFQFAVDFKKHFGWDGHFLADAEQIRGRGLSSNNLGNLHTISNIEATRATRLRELWYEQDLGERVHLRVGQQSADREFLVSVTSAVFINGTFGWPTLPGRNLPSGGPAYPLGTPGVRLKVEPSDTVTWLAAAFNGNPAGPGIGDPQLRDASGTAFRLGDGVLALVEVQYHPGGPPADGSYKLGAWYNSERFPDLRFDSIGLSLANPLGSGRPRLHTNNFSVYAVVDQPLFHAEKSDKGLSAFLRAMGSPGDRNPLDFYIDGGAAYKSLFTDDDTLALGVAYARISGRARAFDRDLTAFGAPTPVRSGETAIELTYQLQPMPWLLVQPDLQYIVSPGGGTANPTTGRPVRDALVLGLRTQITF